MGLKNTNERRIAARARSLEESLRTPVDGSRMIDHDGEEWAARWKEYVADDDLTAFERRLEIEGLTSETCCWRLHNRALSDGESVPEWVERLNELLEYVESHTSTEPSPLVDTADDVPFVDVLAPFVGFASERIDWRSSVEHLSMGARRTLERWLLDRLSSVASHTLFIEFKTFLAARDAELAFTDDPEMPDSPRRYYDQFVAGILGGEIRSLFEEYSTLARIFLILIDQWCNAVESFCTHLRADWEALVETFGSESLLGRVMELEQLGDHHRGGRVVFHLTFESGVELAYKPRDIRPEARFTEFVSWINAEFDRPDFFTPNCLVRNGYGWMEWVNSDACSTRAGIRRYYRRTGSLFCLLYALNFVDGHLENIIAAGEYPVVVDLETLMHPSLPRSAIPPSSQSPRPRQNSVLRTGLLPEDSPDSDFQNMAGFDAPSGKLTDIQKPTFERANTDVMELRYEDNATFPGDSLPRFDGERKRPYEWCDVIIEGFSEMYRFILDNRAELLATDGPLAAFADAEFRYVYRPSITYRTVLVPLTTPKCLRTGRALGCKMERLARPFVTGETDLNLWPVYEAERTALWRVDVPRFSIRADGITLLHDGKPVVDAFDASPLEQTRRRIENFSETDLSKQLDLVKTAYGSMPVLPSNNSSIRDRRTTQQGDSDPLVDATGITMGRYPEIIFKRLRETCTTGSDGFPTWYRLEGDDGGVRLTAIGDDFYEGRLGIAVFCAALAATTGKARFRDFAMRVASAVQWELDSEDPFSDLDVGAGVGIGSFVYGFAVLGELLDEDELIEAARRSASMLTPERFENDTHNDVMSGNAGAILSLLSLYDRTGENEFLTKATVVGDQLLADRVEVDGVQVWEVTDDRVTAERVAIGMAHGVAGIAYALTRLADASGDEQFQNAAFEALAYEDARYSDVQRNWRNVGSNMGQWVSNWCWGRSGIGLSRLEMYNLTGKRVVLQDVTRALDGTDIDGLEEFDHLCCGNFSRVGFLLQASQVMEIPRYRNVAQELATATIRRAEEMERFTVLKQTDNWFNPSFFQGVPGIGYTLLRLDEPELPCVTLWK